MLLVLKTAIIFSLLANVPSSSTLVLDGPAPQDPPKVVQAVRPAYPPIAAAKRVSGTVVIDVEIDPKGSVQKTTVRSGPSLLRKAAKEAATKWEFDVAASKNTRSAQLVFIFHPVSYVPEPDEPDFKRPYQMSVRWQGIAVDRQ